MNYGIGMGYMGLYQATKSKATAKDELDQLKSLSAEIELDREKQKQADLEEQKYYDEISKFADTLLAEDRNRINQKSKEMAISVRRAIRENGGDINKFLQNGGHKVLGAYKSSIVNSSEASMYIENKKNLEKILDLRAKGLGHLINPIDLYSLQQREKNGYGPITFSGQLNDIKVQEIQKEFAYGDNIPPELVLEKFYTQIAGNYSQIYGKTNPTKDELLIYTTNLFPRLKGTGLDISREAFNQVKDAMDDNYRREQSNQSAINQRNKDVYENQIKAIEKYISDVGLNGKVDPENGKVTITNPDGSQTKMTLKEIEDRNGDIVNFYYALGSISESLTDEGSVFNINDKTSLGLIDSLTGVTHYKKAFINYSANGSGGVIRSFSQGIKDKILGNAEYYRVTGAKMVMDLGTLTNAIKSAPNSSPVVLNEDGTVDFDTLKNGNNLFDAKGIRTINWKEKDYFGFVGITNFKPTGVIQGYIARDTLGNERIVTDRTNEKGDRVSDDNKIKKETFGKNNDGAEAALFVVLENEKGTVFYQRVDNNKRVEFLSAGKLTESVAKEYAQKKREQNKSLTMKEFTNMMNQFNSQEATALRSSMGAEISNVFNSPSNANALQPIVAGFYAAIHGVSGGKTGIDTSINATAFSKAINEFIKNEGGEGVINSIKDSIKKGNFKPLDFVSTLRENGFYKGYPEFMKLWEESVRSYKYNR